MRRTNHEGEFATIRQAAARSGIGHDTIRRLIADGEIPLYRCGSRSWPRIRYADLVRWVESTRTPGAGVEAARVAQARIERESRAGG